ncbi:MAG: hypothetical protein MI919_36935, partial [Holophagales bacterium]|nr:hypothetical protein [Holophagales bacterium]
IVSKDFQPRGPFDRLGVRYRSLEEDGFKLIVDSEGGQWLFRPIEDPSESQELSERYPEVKAALLASLATLVEAYGLGKLDRETVDPIAPEELDPEVRERLKSLGYLQ